MVEALIGNAAILLGVVLLLWVIAVRIGDVSFIDAFWGAGMALLAGVSVGSSRVDLQACKLEYSIVSPK